MRNVILFRMISFPILMQIFRIQILRHKRLTEGLERTPCITRLPSNDPPPRYKYWSSFQIHAKRIIKKIKCPFGMSQCRMRKRHTNTIWRSRLIGQWIIELQMFVKCNLVHYYVMSRKLRGSYGKTAQLYAV